MSYSSSLISKCNFVSLSLPPPHWLLNSVCKVPCVSLVGAYFEFGRVFNETYGRFNVLALAPTCLSGMFSLVCIALLSTFYVHAVADESVRRTGNDPKVLPSCQEIALAISPASAVFMPGVPHSPFRVLLAGVELGAIGSSNYSYDIEHYLFSSTEDSVCSIEPGSVEDLSKTVSTLFIG